MANLKNWLPGMTPEEMRWFDKCPKSVLFEIARQFGMRIADDFSEDAAAAFAVMRSEWQILHEQGIVPQKPPRAPEPDPAIGDDADERRLARQAAAQGA